jgi:hypothetical protein
MAQFAAQIWGSPAADHLFACPAATPVRPVSPSPRPDEQGSPCAAYLQPLAPPCTACDPRTPRTPRLPRIPRIMANEYDAPAAPAPPVMPNMPSTAGGDPAGPSPVVHGTYEPNDQVRPRAIRSLPCSTRLPGAHVLCADAASLTCSALLRSAARVAPSFPPRVGGRGHGQDRVCLGGRGRARCQALRSMERVDASAGAWHCRGSAADVRPAGRVAAVGPALTTGADCSCLCCGRCTTRVAGCTAL